VILKEELKKYKLDFIDDSFFDRCDIFIEALQQWGKVHNLTSSLTKTDITKNIIDSIYPLSFLDSFDNFADIGTGAGYPGLLIALAKPNIRATLIEPKTKKVAFLNYIKATLKLSNIEILQKKAQDISDKSYDLITSRAVTNTSLLLDLTQNISDKNTKYLFYKGTMCQDEIKDIDFKDYKIYDFDNFRNYLYIKRIDDD
jgi:16S rRNA (guanine527-N7)-methyltransferase